jgi:hypothetical protein
LVSKNSKNTLPKILHSLTARELFLYSKIPLNYLEGFIAGKFKPNREHREKLSHVSRFFYGISKIEKRAHVARWKFRIVRIFLSLSERGFLFDLIDDDSYFRELDRLVDEHWDEILASFMEKTQ